MKKKTGKILTVTNIIILICILVYVLDRYIIVGDISNEIDGTVGIVINGQNLENNETFIKILGFNFGKLYNFMSLIKIDGKTLYLWTYFTYIFMHQFLIHIIVNLLALYIIGNNIEKNRGIKFLLFTFITTGVIGAFISTLIVPEDSFTAGASIAIFGLIGAAIGICITEKGYIKSFSKKSKIFLIIYGTIFTYGSGTFTLVAHNIGLVIGFIIYLVYYYLIYKKRIMIKS